ncbi:MAG: nitronate monooxygenase [Lautropia sp.]
MKTAATEMFDIEVPIFAFSHCRDVVVEVSKSGGLGVLGCAYLTPEQLQMELEWIDRHVGGKPYGVDFLMPKNYDSVKEASKMAIADLPREQLEFMRDVCDEAGIPRLPEAEAEKMLLEEISHIHMTPEQNRELVEVALRHPIKLVVNALGTPPKDLVDRFHTMGIKVGAMIGKVEHALAQRDAGVDLVIAQGSEAGGHTGKISSIVLWSQVIDAVAPIPVLAAGGIGRGRQMAAAIALGAEGVWCGSIWLATQQSELLPEMKQRLFEAKAEDAIQSRVRTGKPCRLLRSKLTDAWNRPDAPPTLPMPLQTIVMSEARLRVDRARAKEYMTYPVGQIVAEMKHEAAVKQVIYDIMVEFLSLAERFERLVASD